MKLTIILIFCFSYYCAARLVFLSSVIRHGARGPIYDIWNAPQHKDMSGELTPTGIRQHYALGSWLRKLYISDLQFLSPNFNHTEIYVRSTDVNRTLQSAYSNLQGLYPYGTGPDLNAGLDDQYKLPPFKDAKQQPQLGNAALPLNFQNIPVHTVPDDQDSLLNVYPLCKNLKNLQQQYYLNNQDALNAINASFANTYTALAQMLNVPWDQTNSPLLVQNIYDVFISDAYNGWDLPPGFSFDSELWTNMTFLDSFQWFVEDGSPDVQKLLVGELMSQILAYMDGALTGQSPLKYFYAQGHDTNLAALATTLNFSSWTCINKLRLGLPMDELNCEYRPGYAASMLFELHQYQDTNNYYIQILYNGKYMNLCNRKQIFCPYNEWRQIILDHAAHPDWSLCDPAPTSSNGRVQFFAADRGNLKRTLKDQQEPSEGSFFLPIYLCFAIILIAVVVFLIKKKATPKKFHSRRTQDFSTVREDSTLKEII